MAKSTPFHFTIGPVQGFVAQARRTRDIWTGSYLLSYLSGSAMKAITESGGEIVFPCAGKDPLFEALKNSDGINKDAPAARIGSLPNRFKATAEVPESAAEAANVVIKEAWEKIVEKALEKFVTKTGGLVTGETKKIWNRQIKIENQWEIAWVEGNDGSLLDQRKNLRSHFSEEEQGEKCTLCGERQALSSGEKDNRDSVRKWWTKVAGEFKGFHFLKDGRERLCAVCTTKRIFPLVANEAVGWPVYHNYPSTGYMCAIDWFKVILEKAKAGNEAVKKALKEFIAASQDAEVPYDEADTINQIPWIREFVKDPAEWKPVLQFRGDVFFPDSIKNKRDFPISSNNETEDKSKRDDLVKKLKVLTNAAGSKPTPFYAVLLMDGDNMGKLLSSFSGEQGNISMALAVFTSKVENIVETQHDGKLIYAGGDDVFAFLPLDTALDCAKELKNAYMEAFGNIAPNVPGASISAGIVYAHMNTALRAVVRDAHALLDKTAKDEMGRNAFAVRVWKRGGPILTFGKKWEKDGSDWVCAAAALKEALNKGEYSKGFFYRVIELLEILNTLDYDGQVKLLTAEYLKSREKLGLSDVPAQRLKEAEERIRRVIAFSEYDKNLSSDGLLFIRFLAQKEV
ncbi:MAG: type III-B CRISPR-associated protein Cas10/Cmr2 [Candidatus Brocadia sp. UTAMX2]|jgi:CRISPR-associated protein Cmr2|nr:MAG: type III-B CRISPR-associated protein Cas10/Cmr2 [Candidatus Brocadia sp. UTAMX2]